LPYVSLEDVCRPGPVWIPPSWAGLPFGELESFDHGEEVGMQGGEEEEETAQSSQSEVSPSSAAFTSLSSGSSSTLHAVDHGPESSSPPKSPETNAAASILPGGNGSRGEWQCDHLECRRTFPKRHDMNRHKKYHLKPYKCHASSCRIQDVGFSLKKDLIRHQASHSSHRYHCPHTKCAYANGGQSGGFTRKDNLRRHINTRHAGAYRP